MDHFVPPQLNCDAGCQSGHLIGTLGFKLLQGSSARPHSDPTDHQGLGGKFFFFSFEKSVSTLNCRAFCAKLSLALGPSLTPRSFQLGCPQLIDAKRDSA